MSALGRSFAKSGADTNAMYRRQIFLELYKINPPSSAVFLSVSNVFFVSSVAGKPVAMKSGVSVMQIPHLSPALFLSGGKLLLGAHFTFSQTGN